MLDYFGSIPFTRDEAIEGIISSYQDKIDKNSLSTIIQKLVSSNTIKQEYSITGWNMYAKNELFRIIDNEIDIINRKKKLFFTFFQGIEIDIIQNICSYI